MRKAAGLILIGIASVFLFIGVVIGSVGGAVYKEKPLSGAES
jgi:hypothetical protein